MDDTDPQASSMLFAAARDEDRPRVQVAPLARPTVHTYALLVQVVARARITNDALRELRRLLRQHEGRLLRTRIGSRVAWAQASGEGLSVTEFQPRSRAADELRGLVRELKV